MFLLKKKTDQIVFQGLVCTICRWMPHFYLNYYFVVFKVIIELQLKRLEEREEKNKEITKADKQRVSRREMAAETIVGVVVSFFFSCLP